MANDFDSVSTIVKYSVTVLAELAILAGIVKWGVSEYFKKTTEIELLKEERVVNQIAQLKNVTEGVKGDLHGFAIKLTEIDKLVLEFNIKLQSFHEKTESVIKSQETTNEMVMASIQKFNNVELVEYRKNHFVLRVPD